MIASVPQESDFGLILYNDIYTYDFSRTNVTDIAIFADDMVIIVQSKN